MNFCVHSCVLLLLLLLLEGMCRQTSETSRSVRGLRHPRPSGCETKKGRDRCHFREILLPHAQDRPSEERRGRGLRRGEEEHPGPAARPRGDRR